MMPITPIVMITCPGEILRVDIRPPPEIPEFEQKALGMTPGLVRMSVGLDKNIEHSFKRIKDYLKEVELI